MKCRHCKHPQGSHELGRGRGSCLEDGCECRGFEPEFLRAVEAGPVCVHCDLPAAAVDEDGLCEGCRLCFDYGHSGSLLKRGPRLETAGEAAQRYERKLRDGVLDEIVEWLAEEDRDAVLVRDVLEFIHTLRTKKP